MTLDVRTILLLRNSDGRVLLLRRAANKKLFPNLITGIGGKVELRLDGVVLDESSLLNSPMLPYVRMVVSLIEGVEFGCDEIVRLLRQAMRQHSIAYSRRVDYVLGFLHQHPP